MVCKVAKARFQGCLVGAAIGDCLGAPFEGTFTKEGIERKKIFKHLKLNKNGDISEPFKFQFTDDTAMTLSVSSSLLECNSVNKVDMATRFCDEFHREMDRGYAGVVQIFTTWRKSGIKESNVLLPSQSQFQGSGSFGNGAAMRVAPVALFARSLDECIKIAKETAVLTHCHKHGVNGAILQALAVYKALHAKSNIKYHDYLTELQEEMTKLENPCQETFEGFRKQRILQNPNEDKEDILMDWTRSKSFSFTHQLEVLKDILKHCKETPLENSVPLVLENIGADITAMQAVPAAIYCFLRNLDHGFKETLYDAISLGSDTDTVCSMACAIAGAYYGVTNIPKSWISASESTDQMLKFGEGFYNLRKA